MFEKILFAVSLLYAVGNLACIVGAVCCLLFGKDDPRFEGDKLISRS